MGNLIDESTTEMVNKEVRNQELTTNTPKLTNKLIEIENLSIFYREDGTKNKETILMLHGFPSSSHMYRGVIADLADTYHVIAPDYPGFGLSDAPSKEAFEYTFDNLTKVVEAFIHKLKLEHFYLLMHDYGGPIGMRIATKFPDKIKGLIIQNANTYLEGLGEWPQKMQGYVENEQFGELVKFRDYLFSAEGIKEQYVAGSKNPDQIDPISYLTDTAFFDRENIRDIQSVIFEDYGSNMPKYEEWQNFFKTHQPRTLVLWGAHDKFFGKAGGEAYRRDLKDVDIHFFDGGHFILEEYPQETTTLIKNFLNKT